MSEQHDPKCKKFSELVSAYLHGQLSPEEAARLEALLRDSPEHRDRFVREAYIYHQAGELMRGDARADLMESVDPAELELVTEDPDDGESSVMDMVIDQALAERRKHDIEDEANRRLAAQQDEEARNRRFELRRRAAQAQPKRVVVVPKAVVWLSLAALIGLVATLAVYFGQPAADNTQTPSGPMVETPGRSTPTLSPVVAHVRSSIDARWSGGDQENATLLRSGTPVTLGQGLAEIVFDDGTTVIVQGPATFEPTGTNGMRLVAGSIAATVPDAARGFTVATPSGLITDYGTEFGVVTNTDGQVLAQTFSGRIGLTPAGGGDEVQLLQGDAVVANTVGLVREVEPDDLAFVRSEEFGAIQRAQVSPRDHWVATRYRMMRDSDVIAFVPFIRSGSDWPDGFGYKGLRLLNEAEGVSRAPQRSSFGPAVTWQDENGIGDAFVANGEDPVFIDLDTAPGGAFDTAGLVDDNCLIGRPGTTLYITWRMQGDGTGYGPEAYAGLSLMRGDRGQIDEPLFMGCAWSVAEWSARARLLNRPGGPAPQADDPLLLHENGRSIPIDNSAHLWVLKIDFQDGADRVEVYLDPDLDGTPLPTPNLILDRFDVSFDRLRFIAADGAEAWRIDDILISQALPDLSMASMPSNMTLSMSLSESRSGARGDR